MDVADILTLIAAVFASTGFWSFIQKLYEERKKKKTPIEQVVLALGRDKLLYLNKKYTSLGCIPESDYETYEALGKAYIAAGGNSRVKKAFEDNIKSLPVK